MVGASIPHNQIVRNTMVSIDKYLEVKKCEIFPSDVRIHSIVNS